MFKRRRNYQHLIKPFSENAEQQATVNYLKSVYPNVLFTTGLMGIKLPDWAMWLLIVLGYRPGTTDIMIFEPRGQFHGLMIEMKRPKTSYIENGEKKTLYPSPVSDEQKAMHTALNERGYLTTVCYGFSSAQNVINEYMAEPIGKAEGTT